MPAHVLSSIAASIGVPCPRRNYQRITTARVRWLQTSQGNTIISAFVSGLPAYHRNRQHVVCSTLVTPKQPINLELTLLLLLSPPCRCPSLMGEATAPS